MAAVLAATLGVGIFSTAAYFTDGTAVNVSVVTGTADLGLRNIDGTTFDAVPLVVPGPVPVPTAQAGDNTRGSIASFKLKPATLDTRTVITARGVDAGTTSGLLPYVRVALSVDDGATWTSSTVLTTAETRSAEFLIPKQPASSTQLSTTVKVRLFLAADTPDKFQSTSLQIALGSRSIQSIAPTGTAY